jgi:hypothetical protein
MWEKLRIEERQRTLGMLFVGILPGVLVFALLAQNFPSAAWVVGVFLLGIFWVLAVRRLVRLRRKRYDAASVGPLSHDERLKARAKLVKGR